MLGATMEATHPLFRPLPDRIRNPLFISFVMFLSILAWNMQEHVEKEFGQLQLKLAEVATIQKAIQMSTTTSGIEAHRLHVLELYNATNQHTLQAIQLEQEATDLEGLIQQLEPSASDLHIQAQVDRQKSDQDSQLALYWSNRSQTEGSTAIELEQQAAELAQQSQQEAMDAKALLAQAQLEENQASEMMMHAQETLALTMDTETNIINGTVGFCKWFASICKVLPHNRQVDQLQGTTDEAIEASQRLQEAFEVQARAQADRQEGMDLLYQSMLHGNQSTLLLVDVEKFKRDMKQDTERADQFLNKAHSEASQAYQEEQQANSDQENISKWRMQIENNYQAAKELFEMAREEEQSAMIEETQVQHEQELLQEKQAELATARTVSQQGAAATCWYALFAAVLGSCVLFLLTVWMIPVVRVENPLRLIIPRSSNDESLPLSRLWRKRLSAYLVSHFLILLLTLSFAGELLMDYESHNIIGRFEILLLVSISAALVQVSTLHFLPHLTHQGWIASRASRSLHGGPNQGCLATSHEYWSNCHVIALCWEDVIKRGAFLLILFFLEILIVRINVGPTLFKEMGILNQQWLWILAWLGYFIYFRYYLQLLRQDARDTPL